MLHLLFDLHKKKYVERGLPLHAYPKPKYTDKTSNGLTKCILDWCKFNGWHAERVSVTGRWVVDKNSPKGGKWIKPSMRVGSADIHAIIKGFPVMIEIKVGKDRLSEKQKKYADAIHRSGGHYWVVKTFEDFLIKYNEICSR